MSVSAIGSNSIAVELVRNTMAAKSAAEAVQVEVVAKALDQMKVEGQAAVELIEAAAPHLGQHVDVLA